MKSIPAKLQLTIAGAFVFNFLFWQEKLALNYLIFEVSILSCIVALYPTAVARASQRVILLGHVLCVGTVMIYNTELSKIASCVTLVIFAAFAEHFHRSLFYAAGSMIYQTTFLLPEIRKLWKESSNKSVKQHTRPTRYRLLLFPVALLMLFFLVYVAGNRAFGSLALNAVELVTTRLGKLLSYVSWGRVFFIILGAYITGALLIKNRAAKFSDKELSLSDRLVRTRRKKTGDDFSIFNEFIIAVTGRFAKGMMALRNRNHVGFISILLLNVLLLVINVTDLSYIWFGEDYGKDAPMAELLHEGTGVLIFSILLAIMVVLFFFKGNINFYKGNGRLKIVTYIWLIQNAFLVASVCLRDYYYIANYGLAYKRIGVLFFLVLVLAGLISVFIKIRYQKSGYFLFRFNGNVALFVLVIASLQNWDVMIARYNISRMNSIQPDIEFLMSLSDQTLPLIRENLHSLELKMSEPGFNGWPGYRDERFSLSQLLTEKEARFLNEQKERGWLSWNFADEKLYKSLTHATGRARSISSAVR